MGLLSRKRKQPRIVKKKKLSTGRKQISIKMLDPRIREHWDSKKSVHENFKNIGLTLDVNPSLKRSTAGRTTVSEARKIFNREEEEDDEQEVIEQESIDSDEDFSEEEEAPKQKAPAKPDLAKVFDLRPESEAPFKETVKKISSDDVSIMRQLIAKYGDNFKLMFKDTKLNFMHYSKGQLKQRYRSYHHFGHAK